MSVSTASIEQQAVNTIRTLSMDAVEKAASGHPGTPMALAPVAYVLWNEFLRYDPADPDWPGRDRFVLSCGHASMLLYSVLHLAGVRQQERFPWSRQYRHHSITLEDIKNFRQLHSPCAGHPEFGDAPGIETTTGPLGQGVGNSVGMAAAAAWMGQRYNRPGCELFGGNVYALCSDGDIMEGVGAEAASLAGHLKLANLCWIYDDNTITIEGHTELALSEDTGRRFEGYGWHVIRVADANDLEAIRRALREFQSVPDRPTLIIVRSVIAFGAPNKQNTAEAHGSKLGADEVRATKQFYGWPEDEHFLVPDEVRRHFAEGIGRRGAVLRQEWQGRLAEYRRQHPALAAELDTIFSAGLPEGWDRDIPQFPADEKGLATRVSSGQVLNAVAGGVPWLLGGSADLAPSTMTLIGGEGSFGPTDHGARNFHFGVREHAMAAACNGMALVGLRPYGATFLIFSDYCRPSLRLAALMKLPGIFVFTHDSIGLGEDGPTHQPVEHLAALRAIPNLIVIRPADANEAAEAWRVLMPLHNRPVCLALTRQNVPTLDRSKYAPASGLARGAYVLSEASGGRPQVILIGTGSEVHLCLAAQAQLEQAGIATRVVSMPSWELFEAQDAKYRRQVLPEDVPARVAVEAGVAQGWHQYLGPRGRFVGMSTFGASAPFKALYEHFGITPQRVVEAARAALSEAGA